MKKRCDNLSSTINFINDFKEDSKRSKERALFLLPTSAMLSVFLGSEFFYNPDELTYLYALLTNVGAVSSLTVKELFCFLRDKKEYNYALKKVNGFVKKLNNSGYKISKENLVNGNVVASKQDVNMKMITPRFGENSKIIKIIEVSKGQEHMLREYENLSTVLFSEEFSNSAYYVDKDGFCTNRYLSKKTKKRR